MLFLRFSVAGLQERLKTAPNSGIRGANWHLLARNDASVSKSTPMRVFWYQITTINAEIRI
jgi:hypothetical protein